MEELRSLFASILFILVALELNYLLVDYARENKIQIHVVLGVLIIAYARKLVVFDLEGGTSHDSWALFASGFVILTAGIAYWLISRCKDPAVPSLDEHFSQPNARQNLLFNRVGKRK